MSEIERKPFEVNINDQEFVLTLGSCAIILFREKQQIDYLAISRDEESPIRVFGALDMVRWMSGYAILYDEDGDIYRPTTTMNDQTFRELYGWNPLVIEKEEPNPEEEELYLDTLLKSFDEEWEEYGDAQS